MGKKPAGYIFLIEVQARFRRDKITKNNESDQYLSVQIHKPHPNSQPGLWTTQKPEYLQENLALDPQALSGVEHLLVVQNYHYYKTINLS